MFEELINEIVRKLRNNTEIQEVFEYEAQQLEGDPAAAVSPSSNEADYSTVNNNERIYAFTVRLIVGRVSRDSTGKEADRVLRSLVDSVIDDFDKDWQLENVTTPTGYTMINVLAVPSQWGYIGAEDEYRVAEVNIRCRVYADVTKIT